MHTLRKTHKFFIALLLLLVLGLQVQATFACELTNSSGPAKDCCFDQGEHHDGATREMVDTGCCEYSQELIVKGSDPTQANPPIVPGKSFDFDLPPLIIAFVASGFGNLLSQPAVQRLELPSPPVSTNTPIYLATLRLRI